MVLFGVCYQNAEKSKEYQIHFLVVVMSNVYKLLILLFTVIRSTSGVVRVFGAPVEETPEEVTTFLAALTLDDTSLFADFDS